MARKYWFEVGNYDGNINYYIIPLYENEIEKIITLNGESYPLVIEFNKNHTH
ncbi:MAG: hypothetical protein V3V14_09875 [Saprospiraceae bacterium]